MKIIFLIMIKKRRNLNDDNSSFYNTKKLKIDKLDEYIYEKELGDDDIGVVKVVPSLVIGKISQEFGEV